MKWFGLAGVVVPLLGACGGADSPGAGNAGGHSGTSGASTSGAAGASSGPNCKEIRYVGESQGTALNDWVRSHDGRFRLIGDVLMDGHHLARYREYSALGDVLFDALMPAGATAGTNCAWGPGAYLCVGHDLATFGDTLLLGKPSDPAAPDVLSIPKLNGVVTEVHWDGEGFVTHIGAPNGVLELIRLDLKGNVIQGEAPIGMAYSGALTPERPRISVHPPSGRTYVVVGSIFGTIVVSGFERDGTPLFPPATVLSPQPAESLRYANVAAYGEGALIAAPGSISPPAVWPKPKLFRLSDKGTLEVLPVVPLPDDEAAADNGPGHAIVAHGADDAWLAIRTERKDGSSRLIAVDWKDGAYGPIRTILDTRDAPSTGLANDQRNIVAFDLEGTRWVGVVDENVPAKRGPRLFRVDDPSCQYPSRPW